MSPYSKCAVNILLLISSKKNKKQALRS